MYNNNNNNNNNNDLVVLPRGGSSLTNALTTVLKKVKPILNLKWYIQLFKNKYKWFDKNHLQLKDSVVKIIIIKISHTLSPSENMLLR